MRHMRKECLLRKGIAVFLLLIMIGSSCAFAVDTEENQPAGETRNEKSEQIVSDDMDDTVNLAIEESEKTGNEISDSNEIENLGQVEMNSKQEEEKVLDELQETGGVILFGQGDTVTGSATFDSAKSVNLKWGKNVDYEKTAIHSFKVTVDGYSLPAYCIEPKEENPPKGTHTAGIYNSPLLTKALYYSYGYPGYDERTKAYLSGVSMKKVYNSDNGRFALCHMVLSYIYDNKKSNSDAFTGVCSATKKVVKNFESEIETWPDPPSESTISLSSDKVEAEWDWENSCQITPEIEVSGSVGNTISVNVPEGAALIKGDQKAEDGYMTVSVGESFRFSAPAGLSGIYESPQMEASIKPFQPYIIYSEKKQDLVFGISSSAVVSFSIRWVDFGEVELIKESSNREITEGNTYYSLKDAEYGLYIKDTDKKYLNLITDENGRASAANIPYGQYYLKELEASRGYEIDVATHDITVASPIQSETVLEKPIIPDITTNASIAETGESSVMEGGTVNISDTVKYSGVEPGMTYTIEGRLMNKATGQEVPGTVSQAEFTPEKSSGSLQMDYTVNSAGLGGNTVVAFERLYQGENLIATHEDINNEAQSVNFLKPRDKSPDMGDGSILWLAAFALTMALMVGIGLIALKN